MASSSDNSLSRTTNSKEGSAEKAFSISASLDDLQHLQYPEGGRAAVLTVVGSSLIAFVEVGMYAILGVLQAQYSENQLKGMSQTKIAWIGTFQVFLSLFMGAFIGRTFDAVGAMPLITAGTVLLTFGTMMMSLCHNYYQLFLAQGVVVGIGSSLIFGPAINCVAHWYEKKRSTMMGIVTAGGALGSIALPIALNYLILSLGFPIAIRIIACINFVLLVPAIFIVKARLPPRQFCGWASIVDFSGLRDIRYVIFTAGSMLTALGIYNPTFYIQVYSEFRRYPTAISANILAIVNTGAFFGRIVAGFVADRLGPLNTIVLWCMISASVLFTWLAVGDSVDFVVWAAIYGFFSSAYVSISPSCIAAFTPDMTRYGGRGGLSTAIDGFASLVSAPAAGALIDFVHGRFEHMIIFSGVVCMAGAVFYGGARFAGERRIMAKY